MMKPGLTRRPLAAPLMAAPLMAQAPAAPQSELTASREQLKRSAEQLRKADVPTLLEPSFVFRP